MKKCKINSTHICCSIINHFNKSTYRFVVKSVLFNGFLLNSKIKSIVKVCGNTGNVNGSIDLTIVVVCYNREGYWMRKIAINQKCFPAIFNVYVCRCVLESHYKQNWQPRVIKCKKNYRGCQILGWSDVYASLNENDIGE